MGMKVVQTQFVQERLFDDLMSDQERFDPDDFP
jgi:hypothetical protein